MIYAPDKFMAKTKQTLVKLCVGYIINVYIVKYNITQSMRMEGPIYSNLCRIRNINGENLL